MSGDLGSVKFIPLLLPLQSFAGGDAENIGWIIPTPVINHFLTDFTTNGSFTGFPALGIKWQRMESAFLRCVPYTLDPRL